MARSTYRPSQDEHANYLRCATFGHMMDDIPVSNPEGDGEPLWVRCMRCISERHDGLDGRELVYRRYHYSPGYKAFRKALRANHQTPTRGDLRMQLVQQRIREAREARKASR